MRTRSQLPQVQSGHRRERPLKISSQIDLESIANHARTQHVSSFMASPDLRHLDTLRRIWGHPRVGREEILAFRNRRLRQIVDYASQNVPFYRELFARSGLKARDLRTAEDLRQLPISSAQDFRSLPAEQVLSPRFNAAKLVSRSTSGTSGRPFTVRRGAIEDHLLNFFRLRAEAQYGVRRQDIQAIVAFLSRSHRRNSWPGSLRQKLGLYRRFGVNCLGSAEEILSAIRKIRPDVLNGFAGALAFAGQHASGFEDSPHPRIAITGGETLTAFRRSQIERGFDCRAFSIYGSHEFNVLAFQCPESNRFHTCDDNVVLEVLRDDQPVEPGELGEVVATGLHSHAMPFLRYRLGDVARQGHGLCECGQPFSTLLDVRGRMHDYFRMPDGSLLHPDRLVVPIMENESGWFEQYQLVQEHEDTVVLRVNPSSTPNEGQLRHVEDLARNQLPEGVSFSVELVDHLPPEPSGKQRYCKSLVNPRIDDFDWSDRGVD